MKMYLILDKCIPALSADKISPELVGGLERGVMVKVMDCGIVVNEFELKSRYYTHF